MGSTGTVAAKLAGADGKTIYICGRTASGGIVAAKAVTPIMGMPGGSTNKDTSGRSGWTPRPNGLDRYLFSGIASPAEACAAAVSICWRNCAWHPDAVIMMDCYLR
jgi:hypothetical protein